MSSKSLNLSRTKVCVYWKEYRNSDLLKIEASLSYEAFCGINKTQKCFLQHVRNVLTWTSDLWWTQRRIQKFKISTKWGLCQREIWDFETQHINQVQVLNVIWMDGYYFVTALKDFLLSSIFWNKFTTSRKRETLHNLKL